MALLDLDRRPGRRRVGSAGGPCGGCGGVHRWHADLRAAVVVDHLGLRRFPVANSAWLHSSGGRW